MLNDTVPFFIPSDFILQITLPYDTQQLSKATRSTAAIYLACGVDPSKVLCKFCSKPFGKIVFVVEMSRSPWINDICFVHTGFSICAVSCSGTCRIDVAAKFHNTNWLAEQNDTV